MSVKFVKNIKREIKIYSDLEGLNKGALDLLLKIGRDCLKRKKLFSVAFSGGKTPRGFYDLIGKMRGKSLNWKSVHLFQVDERTVSPTHEESNYRLLHEGFISKIRIPAENIHRISAENDNLDKVANNYENEIRSVFKSYNGVPSFDLIFLGVGGDGHTASLFEGSIALKEKKRLVVKNYYKKLGFWRITFTLSLINQAKNIIFMVDGKDKSEVVSEIMNKKKSSLPASLVKPKNGKCFWFLTESVYNNITVGV